jgi:hypothetical protein
MKVVLTVGWIVTLVAAFGLGRSNLIREIPAEATQSLSDALDNKDLLARMYGVAKTLEKLNPDNIDQNLAMFEKKQSVMNDTEVRAFITAWARFDPEAAFAWASGLGWFTKGKFVPVALGAWATVDPQGAVEALDAMPKGTRGGQKFRGELVKGWILGGDPDGATEYILSLGPAKGFQQTFNQMAVLIAKDGVDTVIDWAEAMPEGGDESWAREAAFRAAVDAVAKRDRSRAVVWYEAHREFEYAAAALKTLSWEWVWNGDPAELFEWLQEQPAGKLRVETVRQSYRQWLERDAREAIAWLRSTELTPALDPALAVFARRESRTSAKEAIEWANRIDDQATRRMTLVPILRILAKEDPATALEWMIEHDYPVSVRNDIIGNLSRQAARLRQEREAETEAAATAP